MNKNTHKTCRACGVRYRKGDGDPTFRNWCSSSCAIAIVKAQEAKKFKAETQRRREGLLTKRDYLKRAQTAVNAYVRIRDDGRGCVSCGITTGKFDAGHYRTVAAASQHRYNTLQLWGQCSQCNRSKSGNIVEYRKELVRRIGIDRVEAIENDNRIREWDVEYLKRLAQVFNRRARHVSRLRQRKNHEDAPVHTRCAGST